MKSRCENASARRAVHVASSLSAVSRMVWRDAKAAEPTVATTVSAPASSGQAAPVARLSPTAMHANTATCTALSPQKSRMAPWGDSMNLSRASSPSQPSRIECVRNRSAPKS